MFPLHPQIHVTNTTSAYMFTQVSHVSIISLARCDKHKFRLYVHPRFACWHPQLHVTNTISSYRFTQLSHVSIISPAPCDKHNFRLYTHPCVSCFHYIPSSQWQTQLPPVCSLKCHMLNPNSLWQTQFLPVCSPNCHMLIPSSLWHTQLPPVCTPKCHTLTYLLHWFSYCYCQEYSRNTVHVALSNSQWINNVCVCERGRGVVCMGVLGKSGCVSGCGWGFLLACPLFFKYWEKPRASTWLCHYIINILNKSNLISCSYLHGTA